MAGKILFTDARLRRLVKDAISSEKRLKVRDEKQRGLLVDITSRGTATFRLRREIDGREEWETLGLFDTELSVSAARDKACEIIGLIKQGYSPSQVRTARRGEPTLRELFEFYLEDHAKEQRKTWKVMIDDFERNVGERASERKLDNLSRRRAKDITIHDVRLLKRKLGDKTTTVETRRSKSGELVQVEVECGGPYAANRTIQLLRAIYNRAIRAKIYSGENPAVGIGLYKETPRDRFLSREEIERFIKALSEEPDLDLQQFVWLAMLTGARKSEIFSMRWDDVDFERGTWTIPAEKSKNGKSHVCRLTPMEIQILAARHSANESEKAEFVFPGDGASGHVVDLKRSWTTLRNRAKLPDVTLHDLRRNLGSWMASQNVNVALIKGALNHSDMKTTLRVYAKTASDAERDGRMQAHVAMFNAAGEAGKPYLEIVGEKSRATKSGTKKKLSKQ